jgi:hypothetical protein
MTTKLFNLEQMVSIGNYSIVMNISCDMKI